jgi:hypothetical protein
MTLPFKPSQDRHAQAQAQPPHVNSELVPVDTPARLAYLLGCIRLTLRVSGRPKDPSVARWVDTLIAATVDRLPEHVVAQVDRRVDDLTSPQDHAA